MTPSRGGGRLRLLNVSTEEHPGQPGGVRTGRLLPRRPQRISLECPTDLMTTLLPSFPYVSDFVCNAMTPTSPTSTKCMIVENYKRNLTTICIADVLWHSHLDKDPLMIPIWWSFAIFTLSDPLWIRHVHAWIFFFTLLLGRNELDGRTDTLFPVFLSLLLEYKGCTRFVNYHCHGYYGTRKVKVK